MSTRQRRLHELEARLGQNTPNPYEEWEYVVTIGGANPGTRLVHATTGEECTDTAKVHEVASYYHTLHHTGNPVDIHVTIGSQDRRSYA
jgi:hypothetical protein